MSVTTRRSERKYGMKALAKRITGALGWSRPSDAGYEIPMGPMRKILTT